MVAEGTRSSLADELETALVAANEASELLVQRWRKDNRIELKSPREQVCEADLLAQEKIKSAIASRFPQDLFLAEEDSPRNPPQTGHRVWHVDPLDGTTNYIKGLTLWGVSIALCDVDGITHVGVVKCPLLRETFAAEKGAGAWLNGSSIRCSSVNTLAEAVIGSGFPYSAERGTSQESWHRVTNEALATRCHGASALDLCYVADGRLDGFFEHSLGTWDTAAGMLIASESGARVTDFNDTRLQSPSPDVVAANPAIHPQLIDLLDEPGPQ